MTNNNSSAPPAGEASRAPDENLDRLYQATGTISDPGALIADFIARSEAYRDAHSGIVDVSYGPGTDQTLDIFLPPLVTSSAPVHIFIHGGYWYQFGKDEWSFVAEALTEAGAIVIIPRYSLCPKVGVAEIVQQMRAMLHWTWQNIAHFGGDREQIFVSGHSAGGHLAVELMMTDWQEDHDLPANVIKGVSAISGLYDLRPIRSTYVQGEIGLSERDAERLSPLLRIDKPSTPLIVAVAETDPPGFHYQAEMLIGCLEDAGTVPVKLALTGHNHLTELYELSQADGLLARAVLAQMGLSGAKLLPSSRSSSKAFSVLGASLKRCS